jgi:regulator of sigma E protease
MLLTLAAAVVVLGVLIFVHELGHFMAAKAVGIGVPRFSIGLGPVTPLSFRHGETEYLISWIPFGGYVKMASREEPDTDPTQALEGGTTERQFPPEKLFENKPLWARIIVISAGVLMNALFAFAVYVFLAGAYGLRVDPTTRIAHVDTTVLPASAQDLAGLPFGTQVARINGDTVTTWNDIIEQLSDPSSERIRFDFVGRLDPVILHIDGFAMEDRMAVMQSLVRLWDARIASIQPGSAADEAGFQAGDLIVRSDGDTIRAWTELVEIVRASPGELLSFTVLRGDSLVTLSAAPTAQTVRDPNTEEELEIGLLGVGPQIADSRVRLGLSASLVEGARRVRADAGIIWFALRGLVSGRLSPRELGGPVLIGQLSGQFARAGLEAFLSFMALFSINLAILNLLPIPVLDGGHLVFLVAEGIRGKPVSLNVRMRLTQFGLVILLGIMALAVTNDILRVFGR